MIPQSDLKDVAIRYQRAGLSILPIRADGSKAPALKTWEPLQKRLPTEDEIREWFGNGARRGVAVVCGAVSGGLYALDLDDLTIGEAFITELLAYDSELLFAMPQCRTPRPGKRLFFRYDGELHSTVLAYRVDADGRKREAIALIGDGKYSIVPPTPAECHENRKPYEWVRGDLTSVPTLSDEQLEDILALARLFDEAPKPEPAPLRVTGEAQRVGDRFNQEGDVLELLQRHGWRVAGNGREGNIYLTRPGKPRGVSASWHPQLGTLYVFTTNAPPFEAGRAYSPFAVYTLLEHGGDFSAAAKALAKQYGKGHRMEPERLAPPVDWAGFLRPLKEVEALPVDWLLPNLLARGEITILAGEAGAGKTTLALEIAHALTRDDTTLGERPQSQARVVWLHYDHSEGRIREKYEQTYGEEPEFMTPNMNKLEEAGMLRLTPDTVHLWASMLIAYGTECLIVDTLNDWLGCDDTDKESKVRPLMNALRQLVEKTGVAVLAIHHPNKASTLKRVTALANSYVFGAKADTVALLADPDGEPSATEVQLRVVTVPKCVKGGRQHTPSTSGGSHLCRARRDR
ncbi:MAG: hypothetical protein KatS3mg023_0465 [Armatimonadota bacterium]|nr:MAG: hypothetical protein KatS3mg023_0465 [Armatimonadota bacterium]